MRYDVLKRVMKSRFVMLLIALLNCKIEKDDEVERLYLTIKRDKRDDVFDFFDRETTSVHDIDFFDVVNDVTNNVVVVVDDVIAVDIKDEETDEKTNAIVVEVNFSRFACFVRTCS